MTSARLDAGSAAAASSFQTRVAASVRTSPSVGAAPGSTPRSRRFSIGTSMRALLIVARWAWAAARSASAAVATLPSTSVTKRTPAHCFSARWALAAW